MGKRTLFLSLLLGFSLFAAAQALPPKFGKGLQILGRDSSFYMKIGLRFQNLATAEWTLANDELSEAKDFESAFLIRRSRLKFDGWILSPRLIYKFEAGLSNRDQSGGNRSEFRNSPNFLLDASVEWKYYKNFSLLFGQRKLPGNRERVISSGNLQFVDRSRLNSRFNIDRAMGLQLKHHFNFGEGFLVKEVFALSQGEGRNVTEGYFGGFNYTFRLEMLPFGKFQSKGDYVGAAIKREAKPKLALGLSYDINKKAVRERGQLGSFIIDENGNYRGKDLNTLFVDMMFKYQNFSLMFEYANRQTEDDSPFVVSELDEVIGTYYTGTGLNVQGGYMFPGDFEIAFRYTNIQPDEGVSNEETHYTLGLSKYIVGHKLKVQTDFSLIEKEAKDDGLLIRAQVDVHF